MRRTLAGLMVMGVLVIGGCSDSDEGAADDDTTEDTGSDTTDDTGGDDGDAPSDPATAEFCSRFADYDQQFSEDPDAGIQEVVDALKSLDPPEPIAEDYASLIEGMELMTTVDTSDPEAVAAMEEQFAQYDEASTNVAEFVGSECGIDAGGADETVPEDTEDTAGE
jgi:hypothetical protein